MVVRSMNSYVADELSNKVRCLQSALNQAHTIITTLETENIRLKDVLANLTSLNNRDSSETIEEPHDRLCAV